MDNSHGEWLVIFPSLKQRSTLFFQVPASSWAHDIEKVVPPAKRLTGGTTCLSYFPPPIYTTLSYRPMLGGTTTLSEPPCAKH